MAGSVLEVRVERQDCLRGDLFVAGETALHVLVGRYLGTQLISQLKMEIPQHPMEVSIPMFVALFLELPGDSNDVFELFQGVFVDRALGVVYEHCADQ